MRVELVLAPNPGLMTGPGTNTWLLVDEGSAVVIDPGPVIEDHRDAILEVVADRTVEAVLVTHTHPDHAPLANPLGEQVDAPVLGLRPGPEFRPDRELHDGERLALLGAEVEVIATPGHTADSVCFRAGDILFSGDHVMGGSTVLVEDMATYMASLRRVLGIGLASIRPGHGPSIDSPDDIVASYIDHRTEREAQILDAVRSGAGTVGDVVEVVYADVDRSLHMPASVSVVAHLRKLAAEGTVVLAGSGDPWSATVSPT